MNTLHRSLSLWICTIVLFFSSSILALDNTTSAIVSGVDLIEFPQKNQLYPRDLSTNQASITVSGTVQDYSGYDEMRVKVHRDGVLQNTFSQSLNYSNDEANFEITFNITAELKNYTVELFGVENDDEQFEAVVNNVVAGDVYMINGQSNAQANSASHQDDFNPFARTYSNGGSWLPINQGLPGMWGARVAKTIIENHNVPVAIINQAEGGKPIAFFLKDAPADSGGTNNYEDLENRLNAAGVQDDIRAAIWYQGESDGWDLSIQEYKDAFNELYNDWNQDYSIERFYLFQIVGFGCNAPNPFIFEAHRQLANDINNLEIMSSNNANHDGCHFEYYGGYDVLGDRMYGLMAKDLYGQSDYEVESGDVLEANIVGDEIIIEIENVAGLNVTGSPWADFDLGSANAWVTGGSVSGTNIHLQIEGDISSANYVSYYGHSGNADDWITNTTGVGLLSWFDFQVFGGSGESNEPNCDDIIVSSTNNGILLEAVNEAPIVKIDIVDDNWDEVFSCTNDCNDIEQINLPEGTYNVLIRLYGYNWTPICEKSVSVTVSSSGPIDNDNDGVPQNEDCDDNNPNLPTTPGTSCNDGDPTTTNDVIGSDGCSCEGTPESNENVNCDDIEIMTTNTGLSISNLDQSPISKVQIFDSNWSTVYTCTYCEPTEIIPLSNGTYYVYTRLYHENWDLICERNETIEIDGDEPPPPPPPSNETDCDNISITVTAGQIEISGLETAPITKIKIFNSNWNIVFTCFGDCNDTETVNLPEGEYHVSVDFFDSSWDDVCSKDETVQVGTDGGGGGEGPQSEDGVDLALSLVTDVTVFDQYEPVVYTLTLINEGTAIANNVKVEFPLPDGTAYTSHVSSEGDYSSWDGLWHIDQLGAGESLVLQLTAFVVTEETTLSAFAQVYALDETDVDSSPNNNNSGVPSEDDEAASSLQAQDRSSRNSIGVDLGQNRFLKVERIYPVPTHDVVNLQVVANATSSVPVALYNGAGVLEAIYYFDLSEGFNYMRLEVENLPSGIYTLLIQSSNGHAPIRFVKVL